MPTTKSRSRTVSTDSRGSHTVARAESGLSMECSDEDLSPAQLNFYNKQKMAYNETMSKLENLTRAGATVATNPDGSVTFTLTESSSNLGPVTQKPVIPGSGAQYRLLVDQRTGKVVGSVGNTAAPVTPSISTAPAQIRLQSPASRGRGGVRMPGRGGVTSITPGRRGQSPAPVSSITPGKSPQVVDLTSYQTSDPPGQAGTLKKTFPALSVTAKPQKSLPPSQAKRSELDGRVKKLLVDGPAKFTEWLISQGLVKTEQYEEVMGVQKKLKLGMHSDSKKFPHSGGYVWILEGQSKYTSVFSGSLFDPASEASAPTPTMCLKLLYHWSCQTNIPNVANWVKVQNKKINDFYAMMRAVCVAAVQDEVTGLGGGGARNAVEVGVISLGTTTADGQRREVRVEVLGVLDRVTRQIRLRATEPIPGATQQERFAKIFEMLPIWVDTNAGIVTDFSVDKETLTSMGYTNVTQCSLSVMSAKKINSNSLIMDYLKKVVPKMFQNTLSNLSTPVIQQFLDELTFRELFGNHPLGCFNNIIQRISNLTSALASKETTMISHLAEVSSDPFLDWRFSEKSLSRNTKSKSPSPAPSRGKRGSTEMLTKTSAKRSKTSKNKHDLVTNVGSGGLSTETVAKKDPEIPGVTKDDAFIAQNLVDTAIYDSLGDACCECGRSMTSSGHYLAYLCCTKCRFSTCCSQAMAKHHEQFHSEAKEFTMNKPTITNELMHCVCGFSSNSGNKMAGHLARSGCSSAYPSAEEAGQARVGGDTDNNQEAAVSEDKTDEGQSSEEQGPVETEGSKDKDDKVNDEVKEEVNKIDEINEPEKDSAQGKEDKQQSESPEKESQEEEKSKDEDEQAPAAGGILFGTFFNYMNQKEEDSGKSEEKNENKE